MQLVLGIAVPDFAFVGMGFYDVNTLEQLIRLSFFGSQTTSDDGNVFTVTQKILTVMALDPARVAKARYAELAARVRELGGDAFEDFVAIDSVPKDKLLVSRTGLRNISGEGYQLNAADFKPLPGADGMYIAAAELGLLNFVRKASNKVQAFTYAVTPKESADNVSTQLSSDARVDAGALLAPANAPSLNMSRESSARALTRRNSVVGFGSVSSSDSAGFGWTIGARVPQLDGPRLSYVHGAGQYSLSALVSIPSWWNEVVLEVTTRWVGRDGKLLDGTGERITYKVDVPTDFEPLEASLLEVQQLGPELMESRLDPVALTACRPGAIVIPGRRLWRSTRVTLGYQTADEISVLPNMKGIVASFNSVRNQMTLAEAAAVRDSKPPRVMEIQRPVRVWTSQGTITLPNLATIGIPERCDVPEAARPAGK